VRTQADYEERIAAARRDGNEALAEQLQMQEKAALRLQQEETFLKGPKGRLEEEKHARELQRAGRTIDSRARDRADTDARNKGTIGDGITPHDWGDFDKAFPNRHSHHAAAGAHVSAKPTAPAKDTQVQNFTAANVTLNGVTIKLK
jgi:hypothetical protein